MPADSVLSFRDLRVSFPSGQARTPALAGINLEIPSGALYVLLGPNGAGKTTLLRCITGLVQPEHGSLTVFGETMVGASSTVEDTTEASLKTKASLEAKFKGRSSPLSRLGVLIENPGLYGRLNAREYLGFFGAFYAIQGLDTRIAKICGELDLSLDSKPVAKLSQGNRQKLQLARSLLHQPELLLWDEPTDHLDPVSQRQVLGYLRSYLDTTGATAIVATHRLEQLETVASHFGFLSKGKLNRTGSREEILSQADVKTQVRMGFARASLTGELDGLAKEFGIEIHFEKNDKILVSGLNLLEKIPAIIQFLVYRNVPITRVEPLRPTLADAYARWVV